MAVGRQLNVKGQMRIDVPHLRLIESGVVYDFDTLAGGILAGKLPYVVTGFVPATWVNGSAASSLSLVTADGIFVNYQASENGSMLMVPADRAPEQLSITNSRVSGNFTVSQTNYVSLDLTRTEDATTSDVVHFIDPATGQGTPKIIPLGRTMDYQIHITTAPFSTNPQRCPVMIVVTDASNNIVSVEDARPMMFRLAAGGDTPDALSKYAWPEGRNVGVDPIAESANFTGGDKAIGDMKSWISAMTEMIWQINAGEYWYSNTQMTSTWFMPGSVNDWSWNGTTLTWANPLTIVFTGSTAITNTIAAGSINLLAGNAAYVDFNRYVDGAVLTVSQAPIQTMGGEPATPGIRYPFAWRTGATTPAVRNFPVPAGSSVVGIATTTTAGAVYLNTAAATPYAVVSSGLGNQAVAPGLTRQGLGSGQINIGGNTDDVNIHIGDTYCTYLELSASGVTAQMNLHSQDDLFITSGQTNLTGSMILTSHGTLLQLDCTKGVTSYIKIGPGATSSGANIQIGVGLPTSTVNNISIGNGHSGSGYSAIQIGQAGAGSLGMYGSVLYINDAGTGSDTTIGHTGAGTVTSMFGAEVHINDTTAGVTTVIGNGNGGTITTLYGNNINLLGAGAMQMSTNGVLTINTSSAANPALQLYSTGRLEINVTGTGATTIGNATSKAAATAATVAGDPDLTLVTKGYVDAGGSPTWTEPASGFGTTWTGAGGWGYSKSNGVVHLKGQLSSGAGPTGVAYNLPAGYRPATTKLLFAYATDLSATTQFMGIIQISAGGDIMCYYTASYTGGYSIAIANQHYIFDGISFPTW